ncbi:MAG: adaptor protein MecA [Eubacteriales bacterium]|nr:adaptor protein MecA [Eubacteriales bacterium]
MTFKRIDDNTVNCIITEEDMREKGLRIDDLFEKKKEAMEFLHAVVDEAAKAVDFRPQGAITSMQIAVLPDHSVSLTLSEKTGEAFQNLLDKLRTKLGITFPQELIDELRLLSDDERVERLKDYAASQQKRALRAEAERKASSGASGKSRDKAENGRSGAETERREKAQGASQNGTQSAAENGYERPETEYIVSFPTMRAAIDCCRQWGAGARVPSALYYQEKNGTYCLVLEKNSPEDDAFEKAVLHANEFGTLITARPEYTAYLKEHTECLWDKDAIEMLAKL